MKSLNKFLVGLTLAVACVALPLSRATVTNQATFTQTAYGTGSVTNYTIGFDFRDNSQVTVTRYDTSTTPATVLVIAQGSGASKFTISGGNPGTTVVMGTAPSTTQYLLINRVIPLVQPVVFDPAQSFPVTDMGTQLDNMTLALQDVAAQTANVVTAPSGTPTTLPSGVPNNFLGYDATGSNLVPIPNSSPTTGSVVRWSGSAWGYYPITTAGLISTINGGGSLINPAAGGTGVANNGLLTWGTNALTFTLSGDTSLTLPTSGTVVTGTASASNLANDLVLRDGSGNFSSNNITANNFVGPLTGAVTGNVTGNTSGTAANVTGTVAIGHGGTGQTTQAAALTALTGSQTNNYVAISDGTNTALGALPAAALPTVPRSKIASGSANLVIVNDGSGNLSGIAPGTSSNCLVSNGTAWTSTTCPGGGGGGSGIAYGTDTGTANAYVVSSTGTVTLTAGQALTFIATNANTGASTLNAAGLGVVAIKVPGGGALTAGDVLANQMVAVVYDGTNWQLISPQGPAASTNVANAMVKRDASGNFAAGTITANLTGTASTATTVTTNANMTGPITGTGNVTSVTAQTGTGTTFVMQASPTLTTPVIGAATGSSLSVSGQLTSTVATGTAPLVVSSTTQVANLNAATAGTASTVTTNANLTGVITSVGNATSIASQTGTGTKFVTDTSPVLVTPNLGTPSAVTLTSGTGLPLTTGVTGILPIANGGTNKSSVTIAPAVSSWAGWDASKNLSANNLIDGYTTTATASGTTTLVVGSTYQQYFTGTLSQTVVLPVTSTLVLGQAFQITNLSTGVITVQSSGANGILNIPAGQSAVFTVILASGTTAASWNTPAVVSSISQASSVGTLVFAPAASCVWTLTQASYAADYAANASCNAATVTNDGVATISSPSKTPQATVTAAPPGNYQVIYSGAMALGSNVNGTCRIIDELSNVLAEMGFSGLNQDAFVLNGNQTYTTAATHTYKVQCYSTSGTTNLKGDTVNGTNGFTIKYFPTASQSAVNSNASSVAASYYISAATQTPGTNTQFNFDTVVSDPLSLVTTGAGAWKATAPYTGIYTLSGVVTFDSGTTGNIFIYKNGTKYALWGNSYSSTTGATVGSFTLPLVKGDFVDIRPNGTAVFDGGTAPVLSYINFDLTTGSQAAPILVGSVTNRGSAQNYIDAAQITCSSGSSVVSQLGGSSWISAVGNISSGACAVTIGGYSATPYCWIDNNTTSGTNQFVEHFSASSSTAASASCTDNTTIGTACTTFTANVFCLGTH